MRGSKQVGGAGQQLKRIRDLKFPSALSAYEHLELQKPVRLSGPRAALVQAQLEQPAGRPFVCAREPSRRRHVKSPDLELVDSPNAPPTSSTILEPYGVTQASLAGLAKIEHDARIAKAEWRASRSTREHVRQADVRTTTWVTRGVGFTMLAIDEGDDLLSVCEAV